MMVDSTQKTNEGLWWTVHNDGLWWTVHNDGLRWTVHNDGLRWMYIMRGCGGQQIMTAYDGLGTQVIMREYMVDSNNQGMWEAVVDTVTVLVNSVQSGVGVKW